MNYVLRTIVLFFWVRGLLINVSQACRHTLVTTVILEAVASVSSKDSSLPMNECIFQNRTPYLEFEMYLPQKT